MSLHRPVAKAYSKVCGDLGAAVRERSLAVGCGNSNESLTRRRPVVAPRSLTGLDPTRRRRL